MIRVCQTLAIFAFSLCLATPATAQVSRCLAIANAAPSAISVSLASPVPSLDADRAQLDLDADQVRITFVTHSTFRIESPGGVVVATDYAGYAGDGALPRVVTMNHAHETHYTNYPDPDIEHVLRGWNPDGGAAQHNLTVDDVMIRNVPTDIRSWSGEREIDGNSIFIFETAGLCIGHLGHLHHELTAQHIGWIGRLDVVMVPVDGSYTMAQESMVRVIEDLRAAIIIPMHFFSATTLAAFIDRMGTRFGIKVSDSPSVTLSEAMLPPTPTLLVLPGF